MEKDRKERVPIEKIILIIAATAGLLALAAVAPGIGPVLKMFNIGKSKKYPKRYLESAISRLKAKGYVVYEIREGKKYLQITDKGRRRLYEYQVKKDIIPTPKRWDGKWRLVMFDIQEPMRSTRSQVRRELIRAGFHRLQDSVWVHPYDCEEYVALLKADKRIGKGLLYVIAERVEYDQPLKRFFNIAD